MIINSDSKITINSWLLEATAQLNYKLIDINARLEAELLICFVLAIDRLQLQLILNQSLDKVQLNRLQQLLAKRLDNVPLAYLTQSKNFYGYDYFVNQNVLIPRPESEIIIEESLRLNFSKPKINILDLGCGSGVLGLTLAQEFIKKSQDFNLTLADISDSALTVAKQNAQTFKIEVKFVISDLLTNINNQYDLIIANLPYVNPEWKFNKNIEHEPKLALFASNNGLYFIQKLITQLNTKQFLTNDGYLIVESDTSQQAKIAELLDDNGFIVYKEAPYVTLSKKIY